MQKYDLHVHSNYSIDSINTPSQILKMAEKRGLKGIAVCDHNTIKGSKMTKKIANEKNLDIEVILASEIKTKNGEVIGLYLNEEINGKEKTFEEVVDMIKKQDGLVMVPHPFDPLRKGALRCGLKNKKIDGIEVFNSRVMLNKYNKKALDFAEKEKLAFIGGSDAHTPIEIGNAVTIIEDDLRKEIKNKKTRYEGKISPFYVHLISKSIKTWRKLWGYENYAVSP